MNIWIKFFPDEEIEVGSDLDIFLKKASWTKGRQDNIISVSFSCDFGSFLSLTSPIPNAEWFQFDRYLQNSSNGQKKRILRAVQFKIKEEMLGLFISQQMINKSLNNIGLEEIESEFTKKKIEKEDIGHWLTLSSFSSSISNFSISITEKGIYNGTSII